MARQVDCVNGLPGKMTQGWRPGKSVSAGAMDEDDWKAIRACHTGEIGCIVAGDRHADQL